MTGPIFDTHAHYSSRAFDADRIALLDSLPDKGVVGVCEQATHSGDAPRVLELAHRYPWVVAAIGIHPESLLPAADCGEEGPAPTVSVYGGDWAAEMQALMPYYDDPKVVAVGECGLDYHWPVPKDAQLALFEAEMCIRDRLRALSAARSARASTLSSPPRIPSLLTARRSRSTLLRMQRMLPGAS